VDFFKPVAVTPELLFQGRVLFCPLTQDVFLQIMVPGAGEGPQARGAEGVVEKGVLSHDFPGSIHSERDFLLSLITDHDQLALIEEVKIRISLSLPEYGIGPESVPFFHGVIQGVRFFIGKEAVQTLPSFHVILGPGLLLLLLDDFRRRDDLAQSH
jgi:hypothetical protein